LECREANELRDGHLLALFVQPPLSSDCSKLEVLDGVAELRALLSAHDVQVGARAALLHDRHELGGEQLPAYQQLNSHSLLLVQLNSCS
jgi:hypothetical protein